MNIASTIALAMGASWASGIRLYACVACLGVLERLGFVQLPGNLDVLSNPIIIGVSLALFVIELVVDKVPYLDTGWDAVHTFIRIPAGFVLASGAFAHYPPQVVVLAGLIGGGIALGSHGLKSAGRLAVNHSPEPVTNWALSAGEDGLGIGVPILSVVTPVLVITFVGIATLAAIVFLPRIIRFLKRPLFKVPWIKSDP